MVMNLLNMLFGVKEEKKVTKQQEQAKVIVQDAAATKKRLELNREKREHYVHTPESTQETQTLKDALMNERIVRHATDVANKQSLTGDMEVRK